MVAFASRVWQATRRHGEALQLHPLPTPMPTAYVAQRLDFDDPLWGWQVRWLPLLWLRAAGCRSPPSTISLHCTQVRQGNGWLVGAITLTTFTTWSMDFEWDSDSPASGKQHASKHTFPYQYTHTRLRLVTSCLRPTGRKALERAASQRLNDRLRCCHL